MSTQSVASFVPADGAGRWTKGLLLATLVLSVVGIVSGLLQLELLSRAATGGISQAEAAANDSRQQLIGVLQLLLYVGTVVAFLIWFHRVHKNLPDLGGRELKYTPGWAVGGFFVPFLNLVRPLQVMREVWLGSDPSGLERDIASGGPSIRNQLGTPALIGWWWALFLISGFLGNIAMRMGFGQNQTLDQLQDLTALLVFSDVINIPSALVAIRLVGRITGWQAERGDRIRSAIPPPLPAPSTVQTTEPDGGHEAPAPQAAVNTPLAEPPRNEDEAPTGLGFPIVLMLIPTGITQIAGLIVGIMRACRRPRGQQAGAIGTVIAVFVGVLVFWGIMTMH